MWSSISRVGQQTIQFVIAVVLARLLVPGDFGLVAEAMVFTSFATVLLDFGFSAALIQREAFDERHLTSAFWLNVTVGALLTGIFVGLSPLIAVFYDQPKLTTLTMALSFEFLFGSFGIVQTTILERELNFRKLAAITNAATLVGSLVAVGAAIGGLGVWSIAVQGPTILGLRSLFLWATSTWRPRGSIDRDAIRDLWKFSTNLAAFNAVNFWSRNADNLLVGRFVTPFALGLYSRAYSLMLLPLNQITSTVSVAMYPVLARLQHDRERLRSAYLRLVGIVALASFPVGMGLFVAARPFVLTVFGEQWVGCARVLQLLCVPLLIQSVGSTVGLIYQVCGRTDWLFRWGVVASATTVAGFAVGVHWGINGVAASYAVVSVVVAYHNFAIPGKLIGVTFGDIERTVRGPLLAAAVMAVCVWSVGRGASGLGSGPLLALEVAVGAAVYLSIAPRLRQFSDLRTVVRQEKRSAQAADVVAP